MKTNIDSKFPSSSVLSAILLGFPKHYSVYYNYLPLVAAYAGMWVGQNLVALFKIIATPRCFTPWSAFMGLYMFSI